MNVARFVKRVSRQKRLLMLGGAAVLIVAFAVLVSGCVAISNVNLSSPADAGSNYQITMTLTATSDAGPGRGVFALRIPQAWTVKSVNLVGTLNGTATESAAMETAYGSATGWEGQTGAGFNGHKEGYKWWVGYSGSASWVTGNSTQVTALIDTHGRGGTYELDFVTGVANKDTPENPDDSQLWYIGSIGTTPSGVLLDQSVTLYSFQDVHPGVTYYEAIQGMASKGLIEGYPTGTGGYSIFKPSNSVYRAQFAKMIDGALGFTVDEGMTAPVNFSDLGTDDPTNLYPHEYVWVAYSHNIIKGYTDGTFRPFTPIIRGHVVTMVVRALLAQYPAALDAPPDAFVQTWGNDLPPEHKANARIAEFNNLLQGLPISTTASNALASMPRGEVAQVLWNMMNLID